MDDVIRDVAYEVACVICGAGPQEPCVNVFTRSALDAPQPHVTRAWLARDRGVTS